MIEVTNLSKKFGDFTALDNINFKAKKGEIITLLGPNGAGKSTLMRCLCGFYVPDAGRVKIDGVNVDGKQAKVLTKLGYMPENIPLYLEMKVIEYLRFIADVYGLSATKFAQNLDEVVEKLDLKSVLEQKIATLSKGFTRRVGVAAVMLHKPHFLVLDEPTEGLDPNQKIVLRKYLTEYAKEAMVLISTHLLEEAEALSTRVLLLNHGKLIADTTVTEMKRKAPDKNLSELFYNLTNNEA
ncbi:MAG: ABC transporter ATP-binding protein [Rhodospirillales bacterium]|nr:ABC transporter ATP-binding protein [Rhodospirillales bacterium]